MPLVPPRRIGRLVVAAMVGVFTFQTPSSAAPVPSSGTLLVVGDSLTEGATLLGNMRTLAATRGPWKRITIDYRRGRRASDAVTVVRNRLKADRSVSAVVLALGTNDMLSRGEPWYPATVIRRLMAETRGLPVLWVNLSFEPRTRPLQRVRSAVFNRELVNATSAWQTLRVADWSRYFVPRGASRFIGDGIHLTTSGYRTRAAWSASQIAAFGVWSSDRTSTTTSITTPSSTSTTVESSTTSSSTTSSSTTTTSPGS